MSSPVSVKAPMNLQIVIHNFIMEKMIGGAGKQNRGK
jgi:hypothetical protein